MAAVMVFLAGCGGLGSTLSGYARTNRARPRPQPAVGSSTPELRIADNAVAQAGNDIPIVPVPPLPVSRTKQEPTKPLSPPPVVPSPSAAPPPAASAPQPPPAAPTPPQTPSPQKDKSQPDGSSQTPHTARQLLQLAAERCARLDSYIVRLTRREHRKGKPGPEEIIAFSFRKKPFSIHFKWLGKVAEGREVVYVQGRFENKIHTRLAKGDALLMPAGARLSLSPDNPLVRSASRHPITDAGICHCVESLMALLEAQERGDRRQGTLSAIAPQRRPEYPQPVETLERILPPGVEPELPRGGRRLMFFDPENHLPMLVVTYDDKVTEVEYYRYDRLITPANLDDDDFNPDKLWPAPQAKPGPTAGARR